MATIGGPDEKSELYIALFSWFFKCLWMNFNAYLCENLLCSKGVVWWFFQFFAVGRFEFSVESIELAVEGFILSVGYFRFSVSSIELTVKRFMFSVGRFGFSVSGI
ncbi:hypothetical protein [Pedobacter punctiformis]|uniref:Uncharacterized protein n=1 Tax=Pedobacter punctiformis TaxID=3004097 RepID=A0ABT4L8Q3_9SPHI|nr:hypothetical protein [Pedobacter sp. HCMS5-2]MCZ4244226.1 hypothetical protein [Pedobacter sp. HCMS5-2]